jgi:DNA adenine methylase
MKYLGGKQRLGKHISPTLRDIWDTNRINMKLDGILDPFCGSLGVFKHMTDFEGAKTYVASDYHPDLIAMWQAVQNGTLEYPVSISEEEYLEAKAMDSPSAYKAFVGFGMSFGGRYFGAYSQKYLGEKREDFCKEMVNSLKRTAPMIRRPRVMFSNIEYQSLQPKNKFIYCDPPYEVTKYPIKYRRDTKRYDVFDNAEFWNIMRKWSKNNLVVISETNAPKDFVEIWNMDRYRSAAQSQQTRFTEKSETQKIEKLFIHSSLLDSH